MTVTAAEIAELRRQRYNATVVALRKPHTDLMIFTVRPDFQLQPHEPGQYTTLGLGRWEPRFPGTQEEEMTPDDERRIARRAYSMNCPLLDAQGELVDMQGSGTLNFYVVLVREGSDPAKPPLLTPRLFMLREGDRLQVGEKCTGHYTLQGVKPTDTVVFLSTGTGEAPHNYMLWRLLKEGHQGRIVAACCVRFRRDLAFLAENDILMQRYPNYKYVSLTTRELPPGGRKQYVQDLIVDGRLEEAAGGKLDPATTHVFLCGNPGMIGVPVKGPEGERAFPRPAGVIEILEARGFKADHAATRFRGNIHFEEYW